jgi:hypothetical protein
MTYPVSLAMGDTIRFEDEEYTRNPETVGSGAVTIRDDQHARAFIAAGMLVPRARPEVSLDRLVIAVAQYLAASCPCLTGCMRCHDLRTMLASVNSEDSDREDDD